MSLINLPDIMDYSRTSSCSNNKQFSVGERIFCPPPSDGTPRHQTSNFLPNGAIDFCQKDCWGPLRFDQFVLSLPPYRNSRKLPCAQPRRDLGLMYFGQSLISDIDLFQRPTLFVDYIPTLTSKDLLSFFPFSTPHRSVSLSLMLSFSIDRPCFFLPPTKCPCLT